MCVCVHGGTVNVLCTSRYVCELKWVCVFAYIEIEWQIQSNSMSNPMSNSTHFTTKNDREKLISKTLSTQSGSEGGLRLFFPRKSSSHYPLTTKWKMGV